MLRTIFKWLLYIMLALLVLICATFAFFIVQASMRQSEDSRDAAPESGHFVHAADVDMYIQEKGPASGTPVVLVHAAGGWSGVWQQTMDDLAAHGYHAIAIDTPPLGYSERPDTPRYSREDQAARLVGVLDTLHIRRAIVVGHSFGARSVAQAALQYPDRISGVVFVDAALNLEKAQPNPILTIIMGTHVARRTIVAATLANPLFTRTLLTMFVFDPDSVTDYWVGIYQQALNVTGTTDATADWLPFLLAERDVSMSGDPESYKKIAVPTLVIWGEKDSMTPLPEGEHLAGLIPHAQLVILPGVGHLPPLENTQQFDDALLNFLQKERF